MATRITGDDIRAIAVSRQHEFYKELEPAELDAYHRVNQGLMALGRTAVEVLGGDQLFAVQMTSGFHLSAGVRGRLPKDLWFATYLRENAGPFVGMPQVFGIASSSGLEIGLAATIHPSDFSAAAIKERVRDAAPLIFDRFPDPASAEAVALDGQLRSSGLWKFRRKTRLPPGSEFPSLNAWLSFIKSAAGKEWGAAAISQYLGPSELDALSDLEPLVAQMSAIFRPIMTTVRPPSRDSLGTERPLTATPSNDLPLDQMDEPSAPSRRVWLWAPGEGASHWDELYATGLMAVGWDGIGSFDSYGTLEEFREAIARTQEREPNNNALTCFNFAKVVKPGDMVFAKAGTTAVLGYGIVTGEYRHDDARPALKNTRAVNWLARSRKNTNYKLPIKTLTELSDLATIEELLGLFENDAGSVAVPSTERRPFSIDDAMAGLFLPREQVESALRVWRQKNNIILQGPPGVGKTFVARRLAYALIGFEDPSRLAAVQFHQSYSYEDFVGGYRPAKGGGFELRDGAFAEFCRRARVDKNETYVFIIDEINRGNLARILGEMMTLIEPDKRSQEWAVNLSYSERTDDRFFIPSNVFVVGLMNTADRSLAVVDYALRRRFAFVTLAPAFDSAEFKQALVAKGIQAGLVDSLSRAMRELNAAISEDRRTLGPGYSIGHSYFSNPPIRLETQEEQKRWLREIVDTEITPLLNEYWFDDEDKARQWSTQLMDL